MQNNTTQNNTPAARKVPPAGYAYVRTGYTQPGDWCYVPQTSVWVPLPDFMSGKAVSTLARVARATQPQSAFRRRVRRAAAALHYACGAEVLDGICAALAEASFDCDAGAVTRGQWDAVTEKQIHYELHCFFCHPELARE